MEDEVVLPDHHAITGNMLGKVEVMVRVLETEAQLGFPSLEADALLGAAAKAIKLREDVAKVDLVLGEGIDDWPQKALLSTWSLPESCLRRGTLRTRPPLGSTATARQDGGPNGAQA